LQFYVYQIHRKLLAGQTESRTCDPGDATPDRASYLFNARNAVGLWLKEAQSSHF
jgi:hypothetical protein